MKNSSQSEIHHTAESKLQTEYKFTRTLLFLKSFDQFHFSTNTKICKP